MADEGHTRYLGGKLQRYRLPTFNGPVSDPAPRLKRLLLPQGELAQFHDGETAMRYLAFIELREGTIRGNHYHKFKQEHVYVIAGEVLLLAQELQTNTGVSLLLGPGDLVIISPGVAHALHVRKTGQAIEFSPSAFDRADSYRYEVPQPTFAGK